MTRIFPVGKPPSSRTITDQRGNLLISWRQFLEDLTEFHSFTAWEPTLSVVGGGSLTSSTVYAAYFGRRKMFYDMFLHLVFQVSGVVTTLEVTIPSYLANPERYSGAGSFNDGGTGTPEEIVWRGLSTPKLSISRVGGSNFTAGTDRYLQIQTTFMVDM